MSFADLKEMPDVGQKFGTRAGHYTVLYKDADKAIVVGPGITYTITDIDDDRSCDQVPAVEILVWLYHRPHPRFSVVPNDQPGWYCSPDSGVAMTNGAFGELVRWAARSWTPPP